jgi:hypothetical protein
MRVLERPLQVMFIDHQLEKINTFWSQVKEQFVEVFGNDFERYFQIVPPKKFLSQEETIEDVRSNQPDIIFLGIGLGVSFLSGVELARELASLQKSNDDLNYYIYANTDGDQGEFASTGTVSVCGSCNWRHSKCLNLLLKTYGDVESWGFGIKLKYPIHIAQLRFAESFYREDSKNRYDLEQEIHRCLSGTDLSFLPEIIGRFIKMRKNLRAHHGYWVHSLSHFDEKLWQLKQYKLLKKLYMEAIQGAIETEDLNCLGRILYVFEKNYTSQKGAREEFGLSLENIEKLKPINNFFCFKVPNLMGCYFDPELLNKISSL